MGQILRCIGCGVIKSEVLCGNGILFRVEGGEKNSVFQFSDVAGPRVQFQRLYSRSVKMLFRSLFLLSVSLKKIVRNISYILR